MILFLLMIMIMLSVAFFTLFERKIMGHFHNRKAPNKMFLLGISQPINDAMKLFSKELFFNNKMYKLLYFFSPLLMMNLSFLIWIFYPFFFNLMNNNINLMLLISLISLGIYGLIISGWSSNSSYAMIGAIRSIAQSISYEITFSLTLLLFMMMLNSLNLMKLTIFNKNVFFILMNFPLLMLISISVIAEVNRTPFDLSEGESELVSGFNIEYSSMNFIFIFLSEYSKLMFMMMLLTMLFFNSKFTFIIILISIMLMFMITWIRMTFPRLRYDKLMNLCWMYMLPINLMIYMNYLIIKFYLDILFLIN
uniref:NADH-ubiquinone oxidoreductase chain 1 n=1 Tax=Chelonus formosanus TaxID=2739011 RepID=A0A8K1M8K3_9HYME|nr:NADH dehydrogenase subunit 1 [Chelonus formosanus]